jgi:hypothetical protein
LPIGQLAPRNVSQSQESQPNTPQYASQEEEPFEIELVVPESPSARGSPIEEQQQPEDHDVEDKADEEYPPPSDTEDEKMYRDADEVESFGGRSSGPHQQAFGSTGTPGHHHHSQVLDQGSSASWTGGVQSRC